MASGGPSGGNSSGPRSSFDFGSDDVLCSYDDFASSSNNIQDPSPGKQRSEPSAKDNHESKIRPLVNVYGQQDQYPKEEIISAVEKCMKKYADNLLRHLEGISGRLSQLEVYCYKLERSIGELQADMIRDHNDKDTKLKSLEKHLQEVHRSIQILRDKQELTETQKELSNLRFTSSKESASPPRSQKNEEVNATSSVSEPEMHDDASEVPNQHLALALPHQIAATLPPPARVPDHNQQQQQQPAPPSLSMQQGHYMLSQTPPYYPQQSQTLQSVQHYIQARPQTVDPSAQAPLATEQQPPLVNQTRPQQSFPQYQQQWPQPSSQFTQQAVMATQPPTPQAQLVRSRTLPTYSYPPQQSANPETFSYTAIPQSGRNRSEAMPFGYGPPPPSKLQSSYLSMAPYPSQPNIQGYSTVYGMDGSRAQNYQLESYQPPNSFPGTQNLQQLPPSNTSGFHHPGSQPMQSHPYADIVEKAISMGYPREQVASVINIMGDSGQAIDFNALLDRLNSHPAPGGPPRAWSG
ncbi:mediator of RNA polymerase II transcription subunit 15-like [Iris pallida]|uniref:Mediator of RNA polymerase II transcription subunit 15-like n=1 Tax=Iris pallida TaxID=29817 RepID=A0AAX6FX39_IRIPA|nr:mediator of RNA polymerase II transcription subunit 15-like [Iris pallida]